MRTHHHRVLGLALAAATLSAAGCDDFLEVKNPNILEADAVDPDRDGGIFSRSSFQNLIVATGDLVVYTAWFTNEARVGDTFPTRNEYGKRDINDVTNGTHGGVYFNLQRAVSSGEQSIRILKEKPGIDLARAQFASGFGILFMAEFFCEGTVAQGLTEPGPRMDTQQLLTMAIQRLTEARTTAQGITGNTEASNMATAALVGIARAHLFAGRKAEAATAARQVANNFVFNLQHVDDPSNRGRLGNNVWLFSESRVSLVVGPEWRAIASGGDPRISFVDMRRPAQDGVLNFDRQNKYKGWADPIRLASGLEARYIVAEAEGNVANMVTLINERRAVGNQPAFSSTNPAAVLTELMTQKGRDFWLEAKRMSDWRRNPTSVPFILAPGNNYYKPELGLVSNQTCWPIPDSEKRNNPNWK